MNAAAERLYAMTEVFLRGYWRRCLLKSKPRDRWLLDNAWIVMLNHIQMVDGFGYAKGLYRKPDSSAYYNYDMPLTVWTLWLAHRRADKIVGERSKLFGDYGVRRP